MNAQEVRRADAGDAATVARLLIDFNTEFDSPVPGLDVLTTRFARLLGRDDVIALLAGEHRDPDGFALLTLRPTPYHDGPLAQLEELYIRPELRGRGHGTVLLRAAIRLVRELGGGEMHIAVDEEDRDTRRFYERHGFVNTQPGADERMLCYLQEL